MNGKSTGRALMLSFLSLVLCLAMLVGTTFAWFTDTVTSANNLIVAGNLDIEMDYSTNLVDWNDVTTAGDLFISPNGAEKGLWEPGHTEVAYLRITNAGTLALKYKLQVNPYRETIGKNVEGNDIKLSEVLKFAATEASSTVPTLYTRETAQEAAMKADGTKLTEYTTKVTKMEAGEVHYVALVVYMPETVGNEANFRGTRPSIEFALNLQATQLEHEKDSFGDDYDKDSTFGIEVSTADELAKALEKGGLITLKKNIETAETMTVPAGKTVTLDLNGKTITGTMPKTDGAVIKNNGTIVISNGTISSTAANGGSAFLNAGTATITDATLNGAPNAGSGWPSYAINNTGVMTISNSAVTSVHGGLCSYGDGALLTINNTNLAMSGIPGFTSHGLYTYNSGKIIVNGGNIANNANDQNATGASVINGNVQVMAGTFTGRIENYYGTPTLYGGTYNNNPSKYAEGTTTDNGDGTWTVTLEQGTVTNTINNANAGDTVYLPAGEYELPTLNSKEGITIEGVEGTTIGGENAESGFSRSNFGKNNTYKNLDFTGTSNGTRYTYANGGTTTFENCTFAGDSIYGFHIDESKGATFIFNDCTFSGFNAFAGDLEKIIFNNCTFLYNGNYGHTNIWSHAEFNECTWGDKTSVSGRGDTPTLVFDGVEESYHHEFIGSAESLVAFAATLESDHWKGQKVVLVEDIDLSSVDWNPIGAFAGTFDGNGHKITNLTISGTSNVGFFKSLSTTATVKNVVFDKANVSGEHYVGVVVGWEGNETVNAHIDNVTVQNSTITCDTDAANDNGDKAGAIAGYAVTLTIENCTVKDTTVKAYRDFGGILGYSNGANTIVRNNTVENVQLVIDNDVNYKNYTTDAEHDANAVVGELSKGKVENNIVK